VQPNWYSSDPVESEFYGPDRSCTHGHIFDVDESWVFVEFTTALDDPEAMFYMHGLAPIEHHPDSYRGPLDRDMIRITEMYVTDRALRDRLRALGYETQLVSYAQRGHEYVLQQCTRPRSTARVLSAPD
jgi:hypothetical protein